MTLDAIPSVEPPAGLAASILAALPQPPAVRPWWAAPRWRYAAVIAAAIVAGAILHEVIDGARPAASDVAGTMVAARTPVTLDTVKLDEEPVSGRVSLFRDDSGFGLAFELTAEVPVDVEVANGGRTVRVEGVGRPNAAGAVRTAIALPGFSPDADAFQLSFLVAGRAVASATLRVP